MKLNLKLIAASLMSSLLIITGCEGGGGGLGGDIGDNDPNLVACVGDSLTEGYACDGAPYPSRLAGMISKNIANYGVGGTTTEEGIGLIKSALATKPAYVCIMFGSNDAIHGRDANGSAENMRTMIRLCKENKSIPIVATVPVMVGEHEIFNKRGERISNAILNVIKEEGVTLVDVRKAFGDGEGLLNSDGLHLTEDGGDKLAECFASKF